MSSRILFVDPVATAPYDETTLERGVLGGTEATVVRIASGLARRHRVVVAQRARSTRGLGRSGARYVPYRHRDPSSVGHDVDVVVVVRAHKVLASLRRQHPYAALFLWMHCLPGRRGRWIARTCVETSATLVGVSHDHVREMHTFFERYDPLAARVLRTTTMYNPIAPGLAPDGTEVDRDKLLFLSSPHKGLDQVLVAFQVLKRRCPSLRLYIANPGYLDWRVPGAEAAIHLGCLRHGDVIAHLRNSLCLFYPQHTFRETFGLVFAEANAVGTPAIAHPHGAAAEILDDPRQLCDARDVDAVCERALRWRNGARPVPTPPTRFDLDVVLQAWDDVLTEQSHTRMRTESAFARRA